MKFKVLDSCCGGRMFWRDKKNQNTVFMDNRIVGKGAFQNGWNPNWSVSPDVVADFRNMPFVDETFSLVVFDPPHLTSGSMKSVINKKYGLLDKDSWLEDITQGLCECWRVLRLDGVLVFKWCEANIKVRKILDNLSVVPLFGDFTGKSGNTRWMTFMKMANKSIQRT